MQTPSLINKIGKFFLIFYLIFQINSAFSQILSINLSASSDSYKLDEKDFIFLELINDTKINVEIKYINENQHESKICGIIKPPVAERIFYNFNLTMLSDCIHNPLFHFLLIKINGIEDKNIDFELKSIFNKKKEVVQNSLNTIVIPYSNFYLYFYKPLLDEYKKIQKIGNEVTLSYKNPYYNSSYYDLKKLPTFIYDDTFNYTNNYFKYLKNSISNFNNTDIVLDLELIDNIDNYKNLILPYHQEHIDRKLMDKMLERLNSNYEDEINIISMGTNLLHVIEIDYNKGIIKYPNEDYRIFNFIKNYCFENKINTKLFNNHIICSDKSNNIGEYIELNNNLIFEEYSIKSNRDLFKFDLNDREIFSIFELNFNNGKIVQFSNDYISLNYQNYPEINNYINLQLN